MPSFAQRFEIGSSLGHTGPKLLNVLVPQLLKHTGPQLLNMFVSGCGSAGVQSFVAESRAIERLQTGTPDLQPLIYNL